MGGYVAPEGITPAGPTPITGNEAFAADTNLPNGVSPQTARYTFADLAGYLSGLPAWITGRFYGLPLGASLEAVLTVTGTLYAYPINIPNNVTVSTLSVSVTTGQTGGAAHFGIYKDNGAGYPGELVYDSGAVAGLTSTTVVTKTGVDTELNAGLYWIATIFTASGTFPSVVGLDAVNTGVVSNSIGYDTAAHALATSGQAVTGISVAATYGALPNPFTSGATLVINADTPVLAIGV